MAASQSTSRKDARSRIGIFDETNMPVTLTLSLNNRTLWCYQTMGITILTTSDKPAQSRTC
ncbi:hypothetical protein RISK_005386 [Rhodopirellula islandica]|uniref:Uncharacterized protein n=1 Tax=Rhodopirellula islandica TaxID=595434 RepID=A0A0J1B678_RHOIS|nr:hypothetical protein RISK_005386 [Rhodopirellula islandica]